MVGSHSMCRTIFVAAIILIEAVGGAPATAGDSGPGKEVTEVYDLLRANLPNAKPEEMDRAAIQGLLQKFSGQASLLTNVVEAYGHENGSVGRTNLLEGSFAYIRVDRVGKDLPELFKTAFDN